jgi:hypothetical protein
VSQCKECTSKFYVEFRKECARRARLGGNNIKRILKVAQHLGGEHVQRRHRGENIINEDSIELFQVGIEQVKGVHKRNIL